MTTSAIQGSVLVVEQDHDARVSLRKQLEGRFGWTVFSAANPIEGLATLSKIPPPLLVLLSTRLPLMSYQEFLELKSRNKSVASAPVILLSEKPLSSLPTGVSAWVGIPIDPIELENVISKTVAGSR